MVMTLLQKEIINVLSITSIIFYDVSKRNLVTSSRSRYQAIILTYYLIFISQFLKQICFFYFYYKMVPTFRDHKSTVFYYNIVKCEAFAFNSDLIKKNYIVLFKYSTYTTAKSVTKNQTATYLTRFKLPRSFSLFYVVLFII